MENIIQRTETILQNFNYTLSITYCGTRPGNIEELENETVSFCKDFACSKLMNQEKGSKILDILYDLLFNYEIEDITPNLIIREICYLANSFKVYEGISAVIDGVEERNGYLKSYDCAFLLLLKRELLHLSEVQFNEDFERLEYFKLLSKAHQQIIRAFLPYFTIKNQD